MSTHRPNFNRGEQWRDPGIPRHWQQSGGRQPQENGGRRSRAETWGSLLSGSALAAFGVSRRSWPGVAMAAAGGFLIYHGVTGRNAPRGLHVAVAFTVNRPVEDVWSFWRNFENLPHFMTHLDEVKCTSDKYSFWTTQAPLGKVSWHAEIIEERDNDYLVWRSLPGSDVDTTGSVQFRRAPGDRGTEIHVALDYQPPAGHIGATIAGFFGESAEQQVREDLRHFKQLMEAGEIPTTVGQPHGRRSALVKAGRALWEEPESRQKLSMPRTA